MLMLLSLMNLYNLSLQFPDMKKIVRLTEIGKVAPLSQIKTLLYNDICILL